MRAKKVYAGIGSRSTPDHVLLQMSLIADCLARQGWRLRSGHAPGADQAFEEGAQGKADIFLPWKDFEASIQIQGEVFEEPTNEAMNIARQYHPAWPACSWGARKLHARNSHQILGEDLDREATMVICWTEGGEMKGGTAQALRIANDYDIPVFNLGDAAQYHWITDWAKENA